YSQHEPRVPYLVNEALHDPSLAQAAPGPAAAAAVPAPAAVAAPAAAAPPEVAPPAAAPQPATPPAPPRPQFKARLLLRTLGLALVELGDELARGFRFYFLIFYAIGYLEFRHRPLERKVFVFVYGLATLHILLLLGVFFMSGYISHRHVMPLVALAMPWIALGIIYTAETCRRLLRIAVPAPALALGLTVVCCAIVIPRAARELHPGFLPALSAAGWAKAQTRPGEWLVSNSKYVSYFSERPTVLLNERTPTIAAARATLGSAHPDRFVVLDLAEEGFQPGWLEELQSGAQQRLQYDVTVRGTLTPRVVVLEPIPQVAGIPGGPAAAAPSPSPTPPTPDH
ncbi:MAG: hypothetical protein JNM64_19005, partial [Chloroflexia bacterium]|nr:hypothetical protein [Chloroflexia bacterium]